MAQRNTGPDMGAPVFGVSVTAELADMHPQTLRQYDRMGLVIPQRLRGGARRYSQRDVQMLREIQSYSQQGVSLEGIRRILELENQVRRLESKVIDLTNALRTADQQGRSGAMRLPEERVFSATAMGDVQRIRYGASGFLAITRGD